MKAASLSVFPVWQRFVSMFPWYVDMALVLLVVGAFSAMWGIGGNAASAERRQK